MTKQMLRILLLPALLLMLLVGMSFMGAKPAHAATHSCNFTQKAQSGWAYNDAGYALNIYLYDDGCGSQYTLAEGYVPQGEPEGGYLCDNWNGSHCNITGPGYHFGSYYSVRSVIGIATCGWRPGSFSNLNNSSDFGQTFWTCG